MSAPLPRRSILDIETYVPGRATLDHAGPAIKLSANEGALGPSPRAVAAYRDAADGIWRYPDGSSTALREAIGKRFALDPARIVCGCGSGDVLLLLAQAFTGPDTEVVHSAHGFLMYPMAARAAGATPIAAAEVNDTTSVDAILACVTARTRAVFIANPNNPTGTYLPIEALRTLRQRLRDDVLLVIDSAYAEYSRAADYSPAAELVDATDNTVMTRTFSKFFGLAGLRLGWAYCPAAIADVLNRIRGPFNVALPTQAAAIAVLADEAFARASKAHNDRWLPWFTAELRALGLYVAPSNANFVLVRFPKDAKRNADAANAFLNDRGVIPRKVAAYGLPDCLRITIGTEAELRAAADALAAFME